MEKKHNGAHNELVATCWLLRLGYEVFRNVSPHGPADIIGIKDGELTLFDVKKASLLVSGEPTELKLKSEQIAMGVKLLLVYGETFECRIIDDPKTVYWRKDVCVVCSRPFTASRLTQAYCSRNCRVLAKVKRRALVVEEQRTEPNL